MKPAPKQKGLDYSLLKQKIGAKEKKALCSAVIYGPNAAGKTNLIGAMEVFKAIVRTGNVRNSSTMETPNIAASALELIPNCKDSVAVPVSFGVEFGVKDKVFDYSIEVDLGLFLEVNHTRRVLFEELKLNGERVFLRQKRTISCEDSRKFRSELNPAYTKNQAVANALLLEGLKEDELFLTNGFKSVVSLSIATDVVNWFNNDFRIIFHAEALTVSPQMDKEATGLVPLSKAFTQAMKDFGVTSNGLGYVANQDGKGSQLCSFIQDPTNASEMRGVNAIIFESYGTIRFAQLFPLIAEAFKLGRTLVIDEFDASIHPIALLSIVNLFHNDEINKNGAQLIFNTHNPIFLNANYYRRDEIKFVERDKETKESRHYALSDFGTSGEKGVRKHEDYMKNYFIDQYGAISTIDFSDVIKSVVSAVSNKDESVKQDAKAL